MRLRGRSFRRAPAVDEIASIWLRRPKETTCPSNDCDYRPPAGPKIIAFISTRSLSSLMSSASSRPT